MANGGKARLRLGGLAVATLSLALAACTIEERTVSERVLIGGGGTASTTTSSNLGGESTNGIASGPVTSEFDGIYSLVDVTFNANACDREGESIRNTVTTPYFFIQLEPSQATRLLWVGGCSDLPSCRESARVVANGGQSYAEWFTEVKSFGPGGGVHFYVSENHEGVCENSAWEAASLTIWPQRQARIEVRISRLPPHLADKNDECFEHEVDPRQSQCSALKVLKGVPLSSESVPSGVAGASGGTGGSAGLGGAPGSAGIANGGSAGAQPLAPCEHACASDVFFKRCNTCHRAEHRLGELDLISPDVGTRLKDAQSRGALCAPSLLIDSHHPEQSWLLKKILGLQGSCGASMPFNGTLSDTDRSCIVDFVSCAASR